MLCHASFYSPCDFTAVKRAIKDRVDVTGANEVFPNPEEIDRDKHNTDVKRRIRNGDLLIIKDTLKGATYLHFGIAYIPKKKNGELLKL